MLKYATVDGQRLPYLDLGPPGGPVIIFLHGWAVAPWVYRSILDILGGEFRVIAPYLPAITWNRSTTVIRSHRDWARLVAGLCAEIGIETAHIVGQSTGGGVAACFAQLQPERTASLTLISASGAPAQLTGNPLIFALVYIVQLADPRNVPAHVRIVMSFLASLAGAREQLIAAASIPLLENLTAAHLGIKAPTQMLWGDCDVLFPVPAARHVQAQIAGARLHLVKYGLHQWELSQPKLAADLILRFVRNPIA